MELGDVIGRLGEAIAAPALKGVLDDPGVKSLVSDLASEAVERALSGEAVQRVLMTAGVVVLLAVVLVKRM